MCVVCAGARASGGVDIMGGRVVRIPKPTIRQMENHVSLLPPTSVVCAVCMMPLLAEGDQAQPRVCHVYPPTPVRDVAKPSWSTSTSVSHFIW